MYVPLEKLFDKTGSIYKLVVLASRRALELNDGSPRLVDGMDLKLKPPLVALEEIAAGKVALKPSKQEKKQKEKE